MTGADDEDDEGESDKSSDLYSVAARGENRAYALFVEVKKATDTSDLEWVPVLPRPGSYAHPAYGEIEMTHERVARFVKNFEDRVYQDRLPLDAEHQTKLSGAYGWIVGMRQNADGSADARVEWLDRGASFVKEGAFRYISPEWYEEWTCPNSKVVHRDVLIGAALTTRPFFKDNAGGTALKALVASEGGLHVEGDRVEGTHPAVFFNAMTPVRTEEESTVTQNTGTTQTTEVVSLTEFNALKAQLQEASQKLTEAAGNITTLQATVGTLTETNTKLSETVTKQATDARAKRFTDLVTGVSGESEGLRWLGEIPVHVNMLSFIADAKGEDSPEFKQYVAGQKSAAEAVRTSGVLDEKGFARALAGDAGSPLALLYAEADKVAVASGGKMTREQAVAQVLQTHPNRNEMYRAYNEDFKKGKPRVT